MADPLRVAYVAIGKADDVDEWSGLNAHIRQSLIDQGCVVHDVDQLCRQYPLRLRVKRKLYATLRGQTYALERNPTVVRHWAHEVTRRISAISGLDAVVSTGSLPVAYVSASVPKVIWADATYHALRHAYPEYAAYSRASVTEGERAERAALNSSSLVCFASQWAADDAAHYYGVMPQKIRIIPFGANLDSPFVSAEAAARRVNARDLSMVRFTFVGVDWGRKGGDLALAIVRRLNARGVSSRLTVVGCTPRLADDDRAYVECLGFLSKNSDADRQLLRATLLASHFFLLPTTAECFGVVFAEASAFALPSVSRAVGGVPTAIQNGRTGLLLPLESGPEAYCDALLPLIRDGQRYSAMCLDAYRDYVERLNWRIAGARFVAELGGIVTHHRAGLDPYGRPCA